MILYKHYPIFIWKYLDKCNKRLLFFLTYSIYVGSKYFQNNLHVQIIDLYAVLSSHVLIFRAGNSGIFLFNYHLIIFFNY